VLWHAKACHRSKHRKGEFLQTVSNRGATFAQMRGMWSGDAASVSPELVMACQTVLRLAIGDASVVSLRDRLFPDGFSTALCVVTSTEAVKP